ncbi:MAG: murein biosynthesis protein MurJ [Promicromonosporaceae bacterium]|nr:murein biosynthesis protein MurJ [Promicromonosporaceae bacterium]
MPRHGRGPSQHPPIAAFAASLDVPDVETASVEAVSLETASLEAVSPETSSPGTTSPETTSSVTTSAQPEDGSLSRLQRGLNASDDTLRRGSLLMSLGTLASRATGQVRTLLLVAVIGSIGTVADAFDVGNRLPNQLFMLISAGILQAVLIPQLLRSMAARNSQERTDKLLTVAAVSMAAVTLLVAALLPVLVRLMTLDSAWAGPDRALALTFAYWCIAQLFFYGLFTLLGQVLNARGHFGAFGWAPVANNLVSFVGFGAFWVLWGTAPADGLLDLDAWTPAMTALLAGTATLGVAAQGLLLLWPLRRIGFKWNLRWGVRGIGLRSAGKVVGWTFGAVLLDLVGLFFLMNITGAAGRAGTREGLVVAGNAAYANAQIIFFLPHSLVIVSIVTALFPRMTAAALAGDLGGVRRDLSSGLRTAGVFSVISAAFLLVLARPITKVLLPTASQQMVDLGAPVLQAMALGLVALGMTIMIKRLYFAFEDGKGIFWIQAIATTVMVATVMISSRVLDFEHWAVAAAASYALGIWISVLLRIKGMSRKLQGMDGWRVTRLYVRAALAATAAGAGGWVVGQAAGASSPELPWTAALLATLLGGGTMAVIYVAALKMLRVRELDALARPLLRAAGRLRRR